MSETCLNLESEGHNIFDRVFLSKTYFKLKQTREFQRYPDSKFLHKVIHGKKNKMVKNELFL